MSEEGRSTFSDQISGDIGKVMLICKSEHTSIYGLVGLQESADTLRNGNLT